MHFILKVETKSGFETSEYFYENGITDYVKEVVGEDAMTSVQTWSADRVGRDRDDLPDYKMAPLLGEHSEEIIRSLGYTEEELQKLHDAGIYNTWEDLKHLHKG